jgi:hypothetical protein
MYKSGPVRQFTAARHVVQTTNGELFAHQEDAGVFSK